MALPRFSEMLLTQRENLNIPLATAAHVLRIKEVTLDAFERGDFEMMPQSGYSQGMLSSYARYLGLNPNIVTSLYAEDLYEYENGSSSRELRQRTRRIRSQESSELPSYDRADDSPQGRALSRRISEGGGEGLSTSAPSRRKGRGLVSGPPGRYSTEHSGDDERSPARSASSVFGTRSQPTPLVTGRPYTSAASAARVRSTGRLAQPSSAGAPVGAAANARRPRADAGDIVTRQVSSYQYSDDLVYGEVSQPYAPASTRRGAEASRNIASRERPQVQRGTRRRSSRSGSSSARRPSQARRGDQAGRSQRPQRSRSQGGLLGALLQDPARVVLLGGVALLLVLVLAIVMAARSCSKPQEEGNPEQVSVTTVKQDEDGGAEDSEEEAEPAEPPTSSELSNASADGSVKVVVEVLDGEVAWVEVVCDGKSDAETVTGPKRFEYTVYDGISISVNNTGGVRVTRNGQQVPFESKVQGLGSLTIEAPGAAGAEGAAGADQVAEAS